jgi:hypothetical protein
MDALILYAKEKNNEGANGRFKCVAARGCCVKSEYFGGDVKVSSVVAGAL